MTPPLPFSRSATERLSKRLRSGARVSDEDYETLLLVLRNYQGVLEQVQHRLRLLGYAPTGRIKTTGVLIDKLCRQHATIMRVQDIAGTRIVGDFDREVQDEHVETIKAAFSDDKHLLKVKDRRTHPSHGYRAVHVVVYVDELPVEIQVRTVAQDQWAQIVESLGDLWGRGIRYGEPPPEPERTVLGDITQGGLWRLVQEMSTRVDTLERARVMLNQLERQELDTAAARIQGFDIEALAGLRDQDLDVLKLQHREAEVSLMRQLARVASVTESLIR